MSGVNLMNKVRSVFRKERSDWNLSDTAPLDFPDDLDEDDRPKFNQLKVVVAGDMSEYSPGAVSNGVSVNTVVADDDDSLLGSSSSLGSPGLNMDPCENCNQKRERIKRRRVMKKLGMAALLYLLFMIGEFVGMMTQYLIPSRAIRNVTSTGEVERVIVTSFKLPSGCVSD